MLKKKMSKESLADKLSSVKFKEESKGFRKKLSIFILITLVLGYLFLFLFNVVVAVSAAGIRIDTKNFDRSSADNETIGIEGDIVVRNDHWYSLDINDLVIEMTLYTEDHDKIYDKKIEKEVLPRLKNTEIKLDFTFSSSDIDSETNETFNSLYRTDKLIVKFEVSVRYTIYIMSFAVEIEADIEE